MNHLNKKIIDEWENSNNTKQNAIDENRPHPELEKFDCEQCGCYFWVEDRDDFSCPNHEVVEI